MSEAETAYEAAEDEIMRARSQGAEELDLSREEFRALERLPPWIAYFERLEDIVLTGTRVRDLSSLARVKALHSLRLEGTAVEDLTPIAGTGVMRLWLSQTPVKDISPLAGLKELSLLDLNQTAVKDLARLSDLVHLENLDLNQTAVQDLTPLAALTELRTLRVGRTQVTDLRPIRDLPKLRHLQFHDTPAVERDAELRRLSEIEDDAARTRETLAYLKTLPPLPEPLPWENRSAPNAMTAPTPKVQAAQAQIDWLLRHALLTRVTAAQWADQIETALRDVPATDGNQLPPVLQTMQAVASVLRELAPQPDQTPHHLLEPELRLRIAQLEAIVDRLTAQLRNETSAREAAEALAKKDGFGATYTKAFAEEAGKKSVNAVIAATTAAAVFFLGGPAAGTAALLLALNKILK